MTNITMKEVGERLDNLALGLGVTFDSVRIYNTGDEFTIEININKKTNHKRDLNIDPVALNRDLTKGLMV